jgi:hypothetical protein
LDRKVFNKNYAGMIDSSVLIKEKEYIMARKITGLTRTELFPKTYAIENNRNSK